MTAAAAACPRAATALCRAYPVNASCSSITGHALAAVHASRSVPEKRSHYRFSEKKFDSEGTIGVEKGRHPSAAFYPTIGVLHGANLVVSGAPLQVNPAGLIIGAQEIEGWRFNSLVPCPVPSTSASTRGRHVPGIPNRPLRAGLRRCVISAPSPPARW